jgi:mRNA interferase MazF
MNEGDVVLAPLPQADGTTKNRPAVVLREFPPFGDLLLCGISTQLRQEVAGLDSRISPGESDFELSGLKQESLIRVGFLAALSRERVAGVIGHISEERRRRLLKTLCDYLLE